MARTIADRIDTLKEARRLIAEAVSGLGIPQLESTLREADMNLHWALWNLGEVEELRPELEGPAQPALMER
jgi:hypothetical protein